MSALHTAERNGKAIDVLFLPVSGSAGYGEVARCRMIAGAIRARWPGLTLGFALSRDAPAIDDSGLEIAMLSDSPTRDVGGVAALLKARRPRLAIFDSGGRRSLMHLARGLGARTAFISSRPSSRRRAFSMRRMRHLDEAWLVGDPVSQPRGLRLRERLTCGIVPGTRHFFMGPVFPQPREGPGPAAERVGSDYALFVPGGGATGGGGIGACYLDAAERYARATGRAAVVVGGPGSDVTERQHSIPVIAQLPPQDFVDVLAGCALAVTGGGSVLGQALALDKPVVAAALGGSDQQARVRDLAASGALLAASARSEALAAQAVRLDRNADLAADLARSRRALQLEPGLPRILERIAELLGLTS